MRTTRLAAIFNIHAEERSARRPSTVWIGPISDTGEYDLVRRRTTRFRSGDTIARIAGPIHEIAVRIQTGGIQSCGQADTIQSVVEPGMEVAFQSALGVPNVSPAT